MRPLPFIRAVVFVASALTAPPLPAQEESFAPLFNGRDLSGWVNVNCAPETWAARDGMITCTGVPTGALRTERQYENFILELEWRHLRSGGNAGVFIWASPIAAPGVPFLRAIEVQVLDHGYGNTESHTTHGDVFPIHGSTMQPFGRHRGMRSFPSEQRSRPSPEWNQYRIECQAGVLRLHVNGREVSGGEECVWRKGYIALESEGAPTEWRNFRIKELPSTGAAREQSAPEAEGHRPLYSGVDLRGWRSDSPDRWTPSDWRIVLKEGPPASLETEAKWGDCELIVDCRRPPEPTANASPPALIISGIADEARYLPLSDLPPGKWSRATLVLRARECTLQVDGREVVRVTLPPNAPERRSLGVRATEAGTEFANFYVRELSR